jgi:hypothetical protein
MLYPISHLSSCTISQFKEVHAEIDAQNFIGSHPFNHKFSIITPIIEQNQTTVNKNVGFYYYGKIPIRTFIDPQFIDLYITKFNFNAMSVETLIDSDDAFCIYAGRLMMNVSKDTYHSLGIQSSKATYPIKVGDRWIIQYDLTSPSFSPGKKNYDRFFTNLSLFEQKFNIILNCTDEQGNSITIDFNLPDIAINKVNNRCDYFFRKNQRIPDIKESIFHDQYEEEGLIDWVGAINNDITNLIPNDSIENEGEKIDEKQEKKNDFISNYELSFSTSLISDYQCNTISGLISSSFLKIQFHELFTCVNSRKLTWACVSVWGFEDSPIGYKNGEHSYFMSGENDFVMFILPEKKIFMYKTTGIYDTNH